MNIKLETEINENLGNLIIHFEISKLPWKLDFEPGNISINMEISRLICKQYFSPGKEIGNLKSTFCFQNNLFVSKSAQFSNYKRCFQVKIDVSKLIAIFPIFSGVLN